MAFASMMKIKRTTLIRDPCLKLSPSLTVNGASNSSTRGAGKQARTHTQARHRTHPPFLAEQLWRPCWCRIVLGRLAVQCLCGSTRHVRPAWCAGQTLTLTCPPPPHQAPTKPQHPATVVIVLPHCGVAPGELLHLCSLRSHALRCGCERRLWQGVPKTPAGRGAATGPCHHVSA